MGAQQELVEENRGIDQPSVVPNVLTGPTQPSRVVYAHPGPLQQANYIQAPHGGGFTRYVAQAHAPVQYVQPAPAVALPSHLNSSVPVSSQARAPVQSTLPAPASSYVSPSSAVPQVASTASATYS